MSRASLNDLTAFAAVARHQSFTAAAAELGVSASALSHAMRGLEERLGVRLLARSTRSVAPTEAGAALLLNLQPALSKIEQGLSALSEWRETPIGTLRITTFHWIASRFLAERIPGFLIDNPEVRLEVTLDDSMTDIVAAGFDAGIRLGENVEKDMISIRIGPPMRAVVVATPEYWRKHGRPTHPRELQDHICIGYRLISSGAILPWDFELDGKSLRLRLTGPLISNSTDLALASVRQGLGVGWHVESDVTEDLATGRLEEVLRDWSPPFAGAHLYHPSRRQMPPPLRALIDYLKRHENS